MEKKRLEDAVLNWENKTVSEALQRSSELREEFVTDSGIPVKRLYTPLDLEEKGFDYYPERFGLSGEYPFTRGISPTLYRSQLWRMQQYAGFGSAKETNEWYKYLLEQGATGISMALDLPTQIGYDPDNPFCSGEVGKTGVSVSSLRSIETIFDGISLRKAGVVSSTANAIGPIFLSLILALAEKQGVAPQDFVISVQNDVLKEYIARGTQIFPPKAGVKFCLDVLEFGVRNKLNPHGFFLLACGAHLALAGATAPQEVGFTLANAIAFIREGLRRGLNIDEVAPHVWFLMSTGMDFFEEIAKIRALRRMVARLMKERFGAKDPSSMSAKIVGAVKGITFTAEQLLINIARGGIGGLALACAGVQQLRIPSYDEALALPSAEAAKIALRTHQVVAYETGVTSVVDPLGGSYYVEALTDQIEEKATKYVETIESLGGAVAAIERGYFQSEIAKSAYEWQKRVESGDKALVGVNVFREEAPLNIQVRKVRPEVEEEEIEQLRELRRNRDNEKVKRALSEVRDVAEENGNTVLPILEAVKAYATIGEICNVLRKSWGEYDVEMGAI